MAVEHFDFPFRFSNQSKHVAVVDQDSVDDVANCVMAAVITDFGSRDEVPTFGVPDQLFKLQPLSLEIIVNAVSEWENRAELVLTQQTDSRDSLVDNILAVVNVRRAAAV